MLVGSATLPSASHKIFTCDVGVHFIFNCVTLPDLGVQKMALKTILGV